MRLCTPIESVNAEVDENRLVIFSKRPLEVLSSAVLNGGFTKANAIISIHVPVHRDENLHRSTEDLDKEIHENPEGLLRKAVVELDLDPEKVVGIMTAADLRNVAVFDQDYRDITLSVFVTAGVDVSATAGEATVSKQNSLIGNKAGTINIILLVNGDLTESCMVDAVKTVTEAKTVALKELDVRSNFSGDLASGTVTDSVVIACTKRGKLMEYAGTATVLGELIGKAVKESVKNALQKQGRIMVNRPITQRLEERGISLENAITLFTETCPKILGPQEMEQLKEEIQRVLSDPNVASFVLAGLRLDDDVKNGLIPVGRFEKSKVCRILQTALMDYFGEENIKSKQIKLDDISLAPIDKLGPFAGSILAAIFRQCLFKLEGKILD